MIPWLRAVVLCTLTASCAAVAKPTPTPDPAAGLDPHWHRGVFIEIFVRAWKDSDGDGTGDLKGLTDTLDYLQTLGVRGIWLMPITANSDGDHGYATTDYRAIDPAYGTFADFDRLISEAAARGIGVIMDYVANHASAEHPYFVEARASTGNRYRDWFVWAEGKRPEGWSIWGKNPWYWAQGRPWAFRGPEADLPQPPDEATGFYFGAFGRDMPDFNMTNPEVMAYHEESMRFWLDRGLAGFRFDAIAHLIEADADRWRDQPESQALSARFAAVVRGYPNRYVVCEATIGPVEWASVEVCGSSFAFDLQHEIIAAAKGNLDATVRIADWMPKLEPRMGTFLSNHDRYFGQRLANQFGADDVGYRLAAATLLLGPGTPYIYYGEEFGMANAPCPPVADDGIVRCADQPLRGPMSWTGDTARAGFTAGVPFRGLSANVARANVADANDDPASLLWFYRAVIGVRNTVPAIARGAVTAVTSTPGTLAMVRSLKGEQAVVVINYRSEAASVAVPVALTGMVQAYAWPAGAAAMTGAGQVAMQARSVVVLVTRS